MGKVVGIHFSNFRDSNGMSIDVLSGTNREKKKQWIKGVVKQCIKDHGADNGKERLSVAIEYIDHLFINKIDLRLVVEKLLSCSARISDRKSTIEWCKIEKVRVGEIQKVISKIIELNERKKHVSVNRHRINYVSEKELQLLKSLPKRIDKVFKLVAYGHKQKPSHPGLINSSSGRPVEVDVGLHVSFLVKYLIKSGIKATVAKEYVGHLFYGWGLIKSPYIQKKYEKFSRKVDPKVTPLITSK